VRGRYANAIPPAKRAVAKATTRATTRWWFSIDGRRKEAPRPPDENRERERQRGIEADLECSGERLRNSKRHEFAIVRQQAHQPVDQRLVEVVGDREGDGDRDERDDQPRAEPRSRGREMDATATTRIPQLSAAAPPCSIRS
jgi:hypothetical protein